MCREIKFRAWDGEKMVSPDYIDRKGVAWWKENSIPTSSSEVMQFTGLKDKNGKEIYEGDIVVYADGRMREIGNHKWKSNSVRIVVKISEHGHYCNMHHYRNVQDSLEIIGNIYEHPQLLK